MYFALVPSPKLALISSYCPSFRSLMRRRRQFCLQYRSKSQEHETLEQRRRSANYKPSIWTYDFLQSLSTKYCEEKYEKEAAKLKENVEHMFVEAEDQLLTTLELVVKIQKLGLASYFEEEIKVALDTVASMVKSHKFNSQEHGLYLTSLCFRLLRQNHYQVSPDIFSGFLDDTGNFVESECMGTEDILELFEAAHVAMEGEILLDDAKSFSTTILKTNRPPTLGHDLTKRVEHALALPSHWRVKWFDVRWQINAHENKTGHNDKMLTQLSKINFNMVQATLQNDLQELSRWWRKQELIEKLNFTRDRLVESFLFTVGLAFEPQYSCFRKWLTKAIVMILIIDDVYDVYGSLEELQQFTHAVNRWDPREVQSLPECMRACFQALYDTTNESALEMQRENGWTQVQPHLNTAWVDFCNALLVEAKWYNSGHTPSLHEYLNNAWVSSSGALLSVHSFFSTSTMNGDATEETINFLEENQDFVHSISLIIRLCNDLATTKAEQERGDAASSIVCYMKEENVPEEVARKHINKIISKSWKKINGKCLAQSPILQLFLDISTNMARAAHNMYQHGDGFGVQDRDQIKNQILSVLVHPFNLDSTIEGTS